jgi:hypothetical protein
VVLVLPDKGTATLGVSLMRCSRVNFKGAPFPEFDWGDAKIRAPVLKDCHLAHLGND